jgi:hypothetical protein
VANIIKTPLPASVAENRKEINLEKIRKVYSREKIIDDYESLMLEACGIKKMVILPAAAQAV